MIRKFCDLCDSEIKGTGINGRTYRVELALVDGSIGYQSEERKEHEMICYDCRTQIARLFETLGIKTEEGTVP